MTTPKKEATVGELTDLLRGAQLTVVADYRGLKVADLQNLRTALRQANGEAHVAKNTLVRLAATAVNQEGLHPFLEGPTMLISTTENPAGVAQAVNTFVRTSRILRVKGAVFGDRVLSESDIAAIAALPSREVLIGRLLGQVQAPLYGLVGVLSGPIRKFAYLLQARIDQLGAAADAPAESTGS